MADLFRLNRFLEAQADTYDHAHRELERGRKQSHWMWFIFPQVAGLGSSAMAVRYAISGLAEAQAYLDHPVLGPRLLECVALVNAAHPTPLAVVFGYPDDLKFHSCVTLFDRAASGTVFAQALERWFAGTPDQATLQKLAMLEDGERP